MQKIINSINLEKLLSLFWGISMGTNVVYLFSIGNTYFVISEVYSVFLFILLVLWKKVKFKQFIKIVPVSFKLFIITILLSSIAALVTFGRIGLLYRYVVGIIALGIFITAMINVITLFEYRSYIAAGLGGGILINILFSIIQYVIFQKGLVFTYLYDLFVQPSFHLNVYNFGAQGLFLEPSHMMHFFVAAIPIWFVWFYKNNVVDMFVIFALFITCAMSGAGTSMVVFLVIVFLFLAKFSLQKRRFLAKRKTVLKWTIISTILGILCIVILPQTSIFSNISTEISHYFNLAMEGSNLADSSNTERLTSMKTAIGLIPHNPIGCGWNMVHTLLEENTLLGTATAFSDILEMTLELGIIGISFYLYGMISIIGNCIKKRQLECRGIAIALVATLIMQILGDNSFNPFIFMTIGWGIGLTKLEEEREKNEKNWNCYIKHIFFK